VDVVLAALNLTPGTGSALLAAMHRQPHWERIPVIAVADSADEIQASQWRKQGYQGCQPKFDSSAILEAVGKLVVSATPTPDDLEFAEEMR
jgi:CheY-like chemotaxis protein